MRRLKTGRRPPIYPKTPGHLPCSSLTYPLPLPSRRPSVSFGGFGLKNCSVLRSLKLRIIVTPYVRDTQDVTTLRLDFAGRSNSELRKRGLKSHVTSREATAPTPRTKGDTSGSVAGLSSPGRYSQTRHPCCLRARQYPLDGGGGGLESLRRHPRLQIQNGPQGEGSRYLQKVCKQSGGVPSL